MNRYAVLYAPNFRLQALLRHYPHLVGEPVALVDYRNLCRLLTRAQLRAPKGESRILWKELEEFSQGMIALTGDSEGPLYSSILRAARNQADSQLGKIIRAFGADQVYIELQRHRVVLEPAPISVVRDLTILLVSTNSV